MSPCCGRRFQRWVFSEEDLEFCVSVCPRYLVFKVPMFVWALSVMFDNRSAPLLPVSIFPLLLFLCAILSPSLCINALPPHFFFPDEIPIFSPSPPFPPLPSTSSPSPSSSHYRCFSIQKMCHLSRSVSLSSSPSSTLFNTSFPASLSSPPPCPLPKM